MNLRTSKIIISSTLVMCSAYMFFGGPFTCFLSDTSQLAEEVRNTIKIDHPSASVEENSNNSIIKFSSVEDNSEYEPIEIAVTVINEDQTLSIKEEELKTLPPKETTFVTTIESTATEKVEKPTPAIKEKLSVAKENLYVCGDSIASGFSAYNKLDSSRVMYQVGIPSFSMFSNKHVCGDSYVSIKDYIQINTPEYLLMVYGTNDLGYTAKKDSFATSYIDMAEEILSLSPNTTIIINSIPPLASDYAPSALAAEYNQMLKDEINKRNNSNIIFLDSHNLLTADDGNLARDYNGGDGIHLSSKAYDVILNYIINGE